MALDPSAVRRFLEPLAREPGEIADVFVERRQEIRLERAAASATYPWESTIRGRWRPGHDPRSLS